MEIKKTIIKLSDKLNIEEIPFLRGAVMALAGNQEGFHNHNQDSTDIYRYPKIQYKIIDECPAVVGINDYASDLETLFRQDERYILKIGNRKIDFEIVEKSTTYETLINRTSGIKNYLIKNWLPLNQDNFKVYSKLDRLADKVSELDRILVGNILSFHLGFDVIFPPEVEIEAYIKEIKSIKTALYKGLKMICLDVVIATDVNLPLYLGLGKGVSRGYGVIYPSTSHTLGA